MIGVEYRHDEDNPESSTYEIFETVKQAYDFMLELRAQSKFMYAFVADFNTDRIYKEPDAKPKSIKFNGGWNYDDYADTMANMLILKDGVEARV